MSTLCCKWSKDGMRQVVNTGCSTFDSRVSALGHGNVFGSTITSWFIRAYTETECNGFTSPRGHLRDYDLRVFSDLDWNVRQAVLKHTQERTLVLAKLFHSNGKSKTVHGYILSTPKADYVDLWVSSRGPSFNVITACLPYIVNVESLPVKLLRDAMKFNPDTSAPLPPVGAVFRGDPYRWTVVLFEDDERAPIMAEAGYALVRKHMLWSRGDESDWGTSFAYASMFNGCQRLQ